MKRISNFLLYANICINTFFRVEAPRRKKRQNRILLFFCTVLLSASLLVGYTITYARCYNITNDTPITVFAVKNIDGERVITYLNREYKIQKNPAR
jgi:hypothetical protein